MLANSNPAIARGLSTASSNSISHLTRLVRRLRGAFQVSIYPRKNTRDTPQNVARGARARGPFASLHALVVRSLQLLQLVFPLHQDRALLFRCYLGRIAQHLWRAKDVGGILHCSVNVHRTCPQVADRPKPVPLALRAGATQRIFEGDRVAPANLARTYFTMADWDRTANHFPSRFTNTSIQTNLPLLSLPLVILFSVSLPWTTATLPSTFTSIGPFSTDSALSLPDFTAASKLCFVSLLPSYPTPVQSSARIWPILSTSPAFMASVQSCSSCLIACETLGPLAVVATVGAGVSAKAS